MYDTDLRSNILVAAVSILFLLLHGGVKVTAAARFCDFNGVRYNSGATVVSLSEACAAIECQPKIKANGKVSKKQVELVITAQSLDSCTCNIATRSTTNLKSFNATRANPGTPRRLLRRSRRAQNLGGRSLSDPNISKGDQSSLPKLLSSRNKAKKKRQVLFPKKHLGKSGSDRNRLDKNGGYDGYRQGGGFLKEIKAKRRRRKCKFNKKKFKAGKTVATFPERCLALVCVKESKKVSVMNVEYKLPCTCNDADNGGSGNGGGSGGEEGEGGGSGGGEGGGQTGKCEDYSNFTPSHSMCKPRSTSCTISREGVTEDEKKTILKVHNALREKVAKGNEERGSPGPQPSATNMRQLVWKQELADVAQAWANTCPNGHDCSDCRKILGDDYFVGQNLYWSWSFSTDEEWEFAITSFYDEVAYVPNTLVAEYKQINTESQIGHYTQVVWAETYEIGCGAIIHGPCSSGVVSYEVCKTYVCNYGPAGNVLGRPIYESGETASNCANGVSNKYDGLCK